MVDPPPDLVLCAQIPLLPNPPALRGKVREEERCNHGYIYGAWDLVIKVDITRSPLDKFPIYAAFGVPEIWRNTDRAVAIRCLTADAYVVSEASRVLQGITASMVTRFVDGARTTASQTVWFRSMVAAVAVVQPGGTA